MGSSEGQWPFKVVPHYAEMSESLDVGHPRKGVSLGKAATTAAQERLQGVTTEG